METPALIPRLNERLRLKQPLQFEIGPGQGAGCARRSKDHQGFDAAPGFCRLPTEWPAARSRRETPLSSLILIDAY